MFDPYAEEVPKRDYILSNEVYDGLKCLIQIVLPAFGVLYFAIAEIFRLASGEIVIGIIIAINLILGVFLRISMASYDKSETKYDGSIDIIYLDDKKTFTVNIDKDPNIIEAAKEIKFKVNPPIL